jgi:hypothetical protein
MIDGNVSRPLLKISHRIATSDHDFAHQFVRLCYRALRIVNKPRLHRPPALPELGARRASEGPELKFLPMPGPHLKHAFGAANFALLFEDSIVFGARSLPQILTAPLSRQEETDDGNRDDCDNHGHDYRELMLVHAASRLGACVRACI